MGTLSIKELTVPSLRSPGEDEATYFGSMSLSIQCIEPIHIGNGEIRAVDNNNQKYFIQEFIKQKGEPYLPGSSVKGSIRTYLECLSPKILFNNAYGPTAGHDNHNCFFPISLMMFGTTAKDSISASNVSVSDFTLNSKDQTIHEIKVSPSYAPKSIPGIKIYTSSHDPNEEEKPKEVWIEFVKKDTCFTGTITFKKTYSYELGLLFYVLSLPSIKLGGKKEQSFGKVEIDIQSISFIDLKKATIEVITTDNLQEYQQQAMESYNHKLVNWGIMDSFQQNLKELNNAA